MEQRLREWSFRDFPAWESIMSADTKTDTVALVKNLLLTESSGMAPWKVCPASDNWSQSVD